MTKIQKPLCNSVGEPESQRAIPGFCISLVDILARQDKGGTRVRYNLSRLVGAPSFVRT